MNESITEIRSEEILNSRQPQEWEQTEDKSSFAFSFNFRKSNILLKKKTQQTNHMH